MSEKGKVVTLIGTAISKDAYGRDRLLELGDVVFSGDTIYMGDLDGTKALIVMDSGIEFNLSAGEVMRLRGGVSGK